jgi:hypothetical protein
MLKGILKDRELHSHDETEEMITMTWNDLTFDEVQSVFHNWINRLRWVIENGGSTLLNKDGSVYLCPLSDGIRERPGTFFIPCTVVPRDNLWGVHVLISPVVTLSEQAIQGTTDGRANRFRCQGDDQQPDTWKDSDGTFLWPLIAIFLGLGLVSIVKASGFEIILVILKISLGGRKVPKLGLSEVML